jgi:hypothetical protein
MNPAAILPLILAAAVAIGWLRLGWWQARAPIGSRARWWRIAALAVLQLTSAALLYFTLMPPPLPGSRATRIVATAHAPRLEPLSGNPIALPEAPAIAGAERIPDLATALRRYPEIGGLRIVGDGLTSRDREAARGRVVAFDPPPARGIVALYPPADSAPGGALRVTGAVAGGATGTVTAFDPAGTRVDRQPLGADGGFSLSASTRAAGPALLRLRVQDPGGRVVEEADVPVLTRDDPQPRLLILAGAAGPDVKYLRRWATDAGLAVTTQITAGGGVTLGDAPVAIDAATLARHDVAIVDERSWAGLGAGARGALTTAVRGGMGLIVRVTGPVSEDVRGQWRALGIIVSDGVATLPAPMTDGAPTLTRRVASGGARAVPLWQDARGGVLADWRAVGRGRVALWAVADSFALALGGDAGRYGRAWSRTLAAVARARAISSAHIPALAWAGERMAICGASASARIVARNDAATLIADPASGTPACAAYWPRHAGWHLLVDGAATRPFYVQPTAALPGLRAVERARATAALIGLPQASTVVGPGDRGASWPWFVAWMIVSAALWWLERARPGRRA